MKATAQPVGTGRPIGDDLHRVQRPGRTVSGIHQPETLDQALEMYHHNPELKPVLGGIDVMREHAQHAGDVVALLDLSRVKALSSILDGGEHITFGAAVTMADVLDDQTIQSGADLLCRALREVGSPQIRNVGTVVGNLVTAESTSDVVTALVALEASVEIRSWQAPSRRLAVRDLIRAGGGSELASDELVVGVELPKRAASVRSDWVKLAFRNSGARAVVNLALVADFDEHNRFTEVQVAIGNVGDGVVAVDLTAALAGCGFDETAVERATALVDQLIEPRDDRWATADYRRRVVATLLSRSLNRVCLAGSGPESSTGTAPVLLHVPPGGDHGSDHVLDTQDSTSPTLVHHLREVEGYTSVKQGCGEGECGACTVQLDGRAALSCLLHPAQADGLSVSVAECFGSADDSSALQQALLDEAAVQCGFCTPGLVVAAEALLAERNAPTRADVVEALSGHLCRCTGYEAIIQAVLAAARERQDGEERPCRVRSRKEGGDGAP